MSDIDNTLKERGARYGDFRSHAEISQMLKSLVLDHDAQLAPYQAEALEMICHKLARIVNGDPNYADSWRDIAGYAQLVVRELER
jgi:uncharacterized ferritin-like protein (DUF455 family)